MGVARRKTALGIAIEAIQPEIWRFFGFGSVRAPRGPKQAVMGAFVTCVLLVACLLLGSLFLSWGQGCGNYCLHGTPTAHARPRDPPSRKKSSKLRTPSASSCRCCALTEPLPFCTMISGLQTRPPSVEIYTHLHRAGVGSMRGSLVVWKRFPFCLDGGWRPLQSSTACPEPFPASGM